MLKKYLGLILSNFRQANLGPSFVPLGTQESLGRGESHVGLVPCPCYDRHDHLYLEVQKELYPGTPNVEVGYVDSYLTVAVIHIKSL